MKCDSSLANLAPFSWSGFWWLLRGTLDFLSFGRLLLVTLFLAGNLLAASIQAGFSEKWKREYWLVFLNLLFIPVTIAIGDIGWINPGVAPRAKANALLLGVNEGLFIASIVLGIFWIYRMKGLRWLALAFALIQLWIMFFANGMAHMAITGDWL